MVYKKTLSSLQVQYPARMRSWDLFSAHIIPNYMSWLLNLNLHVVDMREGRDLDVASHFSVMSVCRICL